jgi:hypothetical protein
VDSSRRNVLAGIGAAVALAAVALVVAVVGRDDSDDRVATSTTTSTALEASTTTTATTVPTTSTTASAADLARSIYPNLAEPARFDDPVELGRAFATDFLGFDTDVAATFRDTGGGTGSVELRPSAGSDPTTLALAQLPDGSWMVLKASCGSIVLTTPVAATRISSPQPLLGKAYAFEGRVDVSLYADGEDAPIGNTFVTGRGDGQLGDFTGQLSFSLPEGATRGFLVLSSANGDDGTSTAAIAIRVAF